MSKPVGRNSPISASSGKSTQKQTEKTDQFYKKIQTALSFFWKKLKQFFSKEIKKSFPHEVVWIKNPSYKIVTKNPLFQKNAKKPPITPPFSHFFTDKAADDTSLEEKNRLLEERVSLLEKKLSHKQRIIFFLEDELKKVDSSSDEIEDLEEAIKDFQDELKLAEKENQGLQEIIKHLETSIEGSEEELKSFLSKEEMEAIQEPSEEISDQEDKKIEDWLRKGGEIEDFPD